MSKEEMLRIAEEFREHARTDVTVEFLTEDVEFFTNVIEMIKRSIHGEERKGKIEADLIVDGVFIKANTDGSKEYSLEVIENQIKILEEKQEKWADTNKIIEMSHQINELVKTYWEIKKIL